MGTEQRREARQKTFLKGRILFNNGASTMDCLVRDLSRFGARLALTETKALPECFDLHIPQKDATYRSTLRWRREDGVGVTFSENGEAAGSVSGGPDSSLALLLRRVSELEAENALLRGMLAGQPRTPASAA